MRRTLVTCAVLAIATLVATAWSGARADHASQAASARTVRTQPLLHCLNALGARAVANTSALTYTTADEQAAARRLARDAAAGGGHVITGAWRDAAEGNVVDLFVFRSDAAARRAAANLKNAVGLEPIGRVVVRSAPDALGGRQRADVVRCIARATI